MPTGPYAEQILAGIDSVTTTLSVPIGSYPQSAGLPKRIRMSEAGKCVRRIGYRLLGYPEGERRPGLGVVFAAGNFYEALVVAGMENAGLRVTLAQDWLEHHDPPQGGKIDGIVELPEEGPALLEVKSAAPEYFAAMVSKGIAQSDPEYYAQTQTYLHFHASRLSFYAAVNKGYADIYTELIPYDRDVAEAIQRDLATVWSLTRAGLLPDPPYHKASPVCNRCPYKGICPGKPGKSGRILVG